MTHFRAASMGSESQGESEDRMAGEIGAKLRTKIYHGMERSADCRKQTSLVPWGRS